MAISDFGILKDPRDDYFDNHAQYVRHREHLRMEQMRQADLQRSMYAAQQQMAHNPFVISASGTGATIGTLQSTHDPKDPLSFLSKADNKLLLTGEAS